MQTGIGARLRRDTRHPEASTYKSLSLAFSLRCSVHSLWISVKQTFLLHGVTQRFFAHLFCLPVKVILCYTRVHTKTYWLVISEDALNGGLVKLIPHRTDFLNKSYYFVY